MSDGKPLPDLAPTLARHARLRARLMDRDSIHGVKNDDVVAHMDDAARLLRDAQAEIVRLRGIIESAGPAIGMRFTDFRIVQDEIASWEKDKRWRLQ